MLQMMFLEWDLGGGEGPQHLPQVSKLFSCKEVKSPVHWDIADVRFALRLGAVVTVLDYKDKG